MRYNNFKMVLATAAISLLVVCSSVYSENTESIGKEDPFETVKPLTDAKKSLIRRIVPSNDNDDQQVIEVPELFIKTVMLKFLKAENLSSAVANMNSPYGTTVTDIETNSLIICDSKESIEKIVAEIQKADQTPEQILIEVVILDVQIEDDTEIGVDWNARFGSSTKNFANEAIPYSKEFTQGLIPTSMGGGALSLINSGIEVTVQALQQTRDVEILASPRVLVLSGQEAYLETIEEIPYTELSESSGSGGDAITSTEFKDAGIKLTVKATVTDDDDILLNVEPSQSVNTGVASSATNSTVPIVDKRTVKTTLLMEDGQVVVIGGLRQQSNQIIHNKVPLLGDIPIIGFLFSNEKEVVSNSELMILLSPHIYDNGELSEKESEIFNKLRDKDVLEFPAKPKINDPLVILDWLDEQLED